METRVGEIADALPVKVHEGDTLGRALQVMLWCRIRHLPVMHDDTLVGVLSERDILRRYADVGRLEGEVLLVGAVMHRNPVTIDVEQDMWTAARLMVDKGIGCLPVLAGGRLCGLVTRRDLLARVAPPDEVTAGAPSEGPGSAAP